MRARPAVLIDVARGEAQIGRLVVAISAAGSRGELRIEEHATGVVLRPLNFGERARILARALCAGYPVEETCAGILAASLVHADENPSAVAEILALVLAGAGEEAPPFAQTVSLVARATGWEYAQLADADALEIDRLAMQLAEPKSASAWNTLMLASEPAVELRAIRGELAGNLLARAAAPREGNPSASFERGDESVLPRPHEENKVPRRAGAPLSTNAARHAVFGEDHPQSASVSHTSSPLPELETAAAAASAPAAPREFLPPRLRLRETRELGISFSAGPPTSVVSAQTRAMPRIPSPSPVFSERADFGRNRPLDWPNPHTEVTPPPCAATPPGSPLPLALDFSALLPPDAPVERARPLSLPGISTPACDAADAIAALLHQEADLRGIDR